MQIRVEDGQVQEFELTNDILYRKDPGGGEPVVRRTDPVLRLWRVVSSTAAEREALERSPYRIARIEGLSSTAELSIPDDQITGRESHPERFFGGETTDPPLQAPRKDAVGSAEDELAEADTGGTDEPDGEAIEFGPGEATPEKLGADETTDA